MKDRLRNYVRNDLAEWILLTLFSLDGAIMAVLGASGITNHAYIFLSMLACKGGIDELRKIYYGNAKPDVQ